MAIFRKSGNFYHWSILLQLPPILHQWPCLENSKLLPPSFYTCLIGGAYLVINLWWIQNNKNVYHFWDEHKDRCFRQCKLNQYINLYVYIYSKLRIVNYSAGKLSLINTGQAWTPLCFSDHLFTAWIVLASS